MHKSLRTNRHRVLCRLLVEARSKAGLTQAKLAKRLRKHQSFVSKIEIGERGLDLVQFIALTDAMGADSVRILKAVRKAKP